MRYLFRDHRPYPPPVEAPLDEAGKAEIMVAADLVLGSFGVSPAESRIDVVDVKSELLDRLTGEASEPRIRTHKVFVFRTIGGIDVAGERFVVSFAPDRTLRKILGRWSPLEYEKSQFSTELTEKEIVAKAAQAVAETWDDPAGIISIRVHTHFVVNRGSDVNTLDLRATAFVETHSPSDDGEGRWVGIPFDI